MKKIVALVLSLVMALSLCTVAFAAEAVKNGDTVYDKKSDDADTNSYTYVDEKYEANANNYLPHFKAYDENGNELWFAVGGKDDTTLYVAGGKEAAVTLGDQIDVNDPDLLYNYKADAKVAKQAWSCTTDELKAGWKYTDENDETVYCVEDKNAENPVYVLFEGKIYTCRTYEPIKGQHLLYTKGGKDYEVKDKVGVYEATCAACGKVIQYQKTAVTVGNYLYQDLTAEYADWLVENVIDAAKPVGTAWVTGRIYIAGVGDNGTKPAEGVTSAKTFDAGVAIYVGMSLLSVAGGAVVIGKKKEF